MNPRRLAFLLPGLLILASCGNRLPHRLRLEADSEIGRIEQGEQQLRRYEDEVRRDLAQNPDLFRGTTVISEWPSRLSAAERKLAAAKDDIHELKRLLRQDREESRGRAEQLLAEERSMRETALHEAEAVDAAANKWLSFRRDLPNSLSNMEREYQSVRAVDLAPAAAAVAKAEQDWPAKKSDLDGRLAALRAAPGVVEAKWRETEGLRQTASTGKASGSDTATLIQADDLLSKEAVDLPQQARELRDLSGQLYDSWDKVLTDLDVANEGGDTVYREKLRTVRTHLIDVAAKKTDVTSDEQWANVPEPSYHAVENDLGMVIVHKDAGLFDSEAQNKAQPAGFAYIAPPAQVSNQYGYWSGSGPSAFWTFFPQYLLMRELLWGHDYRPVVIHEYYGYRTAQQSGRTYYGTDTVTGTPKYGSHGTFTQQHYADSRYVQSGGFGGSKYAAHGSAQRPQERFAPRAESPREDGAGRRFGSGASRGSSQGRRFGSGGSRSPGRSFGRRR